MKKFGLFTDRSRTGEEHILRQQRVCPARAAFLASGLLAACLLSGGLLSGCQGRDEEETAVLSADLSYQDTDGYIYEPCEEMVYVIGTVNVRAEATARSEQVGILEDGDEILRVAYNPSWSKVMYQGELCYMASQYLTTEDPKKAVTTEALETEDSETEASETEASETEVSGSEAADTKGSTEVSSTKAASTKAASTEAASTKANRTDAASTETPKKQ